MGDHVCEDEFKRRGLFPSRALCMALNITGRLNDGGFTVECSLSHTLCTVEGDIFLCSVCCCCCQPRQTQACQSSWLCPPLPRTLPQSVQDSPLVSSSLHNIALLHPRRPRATH